MPEGEPSEQAGDDAQEEESADSAFYDDEFGELEAEWQALVAERDSLRSELERINGELAGVRGELESVRGGAPVDPPAPEPEAPPESDHWFYRRLFERR